MIIAITGTPGTGKTTLSKKLASALKYEILDVNEFIETHEDVIIEFDTERQTKIIDEKKLINYIEQQIETEGITDLIIDSHLSHYISNRIITVCIVLSCELKELKKRLLSRGYNKLKIKENLEAETFDTILSEAQDLNHTILSIDAKKQFNMKKIMTNLKKLQKSN